MMSRYAAWCRKKGATAECSPALMVLGALVVLAAIIYVYRQVIIDTLITIGIVVGSLAGAAIVTAVAVSTVRWYRRNAAKARWAEAKAHGTEHTAPADSIPETASLADEEAISREADWLASGVELAFGPDGELRAKTRK